MDGPGPNLQPREPAPDVHQAGGVTGRHHVGTRAPNSVDLVGQHGGGGVGVLQTERAPEPAARLGFGELDEVQATHGAEECQRPVSHAQHPQAVAGRVVGDPVGKVGTDIGDAEDVDDELRQLVCAGSVALDRGDELRVARDLIEQPPGTRHVTYVPEVVKRQLREEIKQEVMAKAQKENWASPGTYPEWAQRIRFYGDARVRYQGNYFPTGNDQAGAWRSQPSSSQTRRGSVNVWTQP